MKVYQCAAGILGFQMFNIFNGINYCVTVNPKPPLRAYYSFIWDNVGSDLKLQSRVPLDGKLQKAPIAQRGVPGALIGSLGFFGDGA